MSKQDSVGRFVWYELLTTDVEAAIGFYTKVVGWSIEKFSVPGGEGEYPMWKPATAPSIGGVMKLPDEARAMGAPTHWMGHITTSNVEATAAEAVKRGGRTLSPVIEIPTVGRFQTIQDPWGAVFSAFTPAGEMPPAGVPVPGQVCWHELFTGDLDGAVAFYTALFGWERGDAMDMGPMGTYQLFKIDGQGWGGMMKKPDQMPVGAWVYYVVVPDLDAALAATTKAGGQVVFGPMVVPGGGRCGQIIDPQGGFFAYFEMSGAQG